MDSNARRTGQITSCIPNPITPKTIPTMPGALARFLAVAVPTMPSTSARIGNISNIHKILQVSAGDEELLEKPPVVIYSPRNSGSGVNEMMPKIRPNIPAALAMYILLLMMLMTARLFKKILPFSRKSMEVSIKPLQGFTKFKRSFNSFAIQYLKIFRRDGERSM
jgi:hypothetical protein